MDTISQQIVACARSWIDTRFHHQGRLKKQTTHAGGVDCLGLLMGVAQELQLCNKQGHLLTEFDNCTYPHFPKGQEFKNQLEAQLTAIEIADIMPGDIALFMLDNSPQHVGIISNYCHVKHKVGLGIIHAYAQARKVVEHELSKDWLNKIVALYRVY